jgi:branched-subunit amino acid aminotransferase/4-amino-4-deoxychorismate lyase
MRNNGDVNEPQAYLDGRMVPLSEAAVPVSDMGLMLGASVTEQLRTFSGQLYHLNDHLERLWQSLEVVGIDPGLTPAEMADIAQQLVATNYRLIDPESDLGLCLFVTPGPSPMLAGGQSGKARVCLHTYQLPFALWADKYATGQALMVTDVRQVPSQCWPARLKCRSRMHYFLADRSAAATDPGARALLLDADGHVLEATTANLIIFHKNQGLVVPPHEQVLPGISLAVLLELAARLDLAHSERNLTPDDVARADEVMLSSTPFCLLPVTRFNKVSIGTGRPGPVFQQLIDAWSAAVGLDIVGQATRSRDASGEV